MPRRPSRGVSWPVWGASAADRAAGHTSSRHQPSSIGGMAAIAIELDGVLGDTKPLWDAWLVDVSRRAHVDPARLDEELPNWRALLTRFAEDHAPLYLRPDARATAALRRLQAEGVRLGAFTDAPEEL